MTFPLASASADPHYDGSPSFSDFTPFGGWSAPTIKQFKGDTTLCGKGVDENCE